MCQLFGSSSFVIGTRCLRCFERARRGHVCAPGSQHVLLVSIIIFHLDELSEKSFIFFYFEVSELCPTCRVEIFETSDSAEEQELGLDLEDDVPRVGRA